MLLGMLHKSAIPNQIRLYKTQFSIFGFFYQQIAVAQGLIE